MLNIGRGRLRERPQPTLFTTTTGVVQLSVAHAHTQGNPEWIKWPLVTSGSHVTTTKKKARGKAQNLLPIRTASGQGLFRSKEPTRADIVQLPVAHAQNILPDMWMTSLRGHVTDVTSGHVTNVTCGSTPSNTTLSVPIYYCSWIYNYQCNQCLSSLTLSVRIPLMARSTRCKIM
jgi:hypothetical protein